MSGSPPKIPNEGLFCIHKTPTLRCWGDTGAAGIMLAPGTDDPQAHSDGYMPRARSGHVATTSPTIIDTFTLIWEIPGRNMGVQYWMAPLEPPSRVAHNPRQPHN